jgi:hypothetical protein
VAHHLIPNRVLRILEFSGKLGEKRLGIRDLYKYQSAQVQRILKMRRSPPTFSPTLCCLMFWQNQGYSWPAE